jgi:hypothetical protein
VSDAVRELLALYRDVALKAYSMSREDRGRLISLSAAALCTFLAVVIVLPDDWEGPATANEFEQSDTDWIDELWQQDRGR